MDFLREKNVPDSTSLEHLAKYQKMLSGFQLHESYLKDTNACDDGNHGDNDENNETAEAIWGPPSPTIDFVQPSVTPAHTHTLSTISTLLLAHSTVLLCSQLG